MGVIESLTSISGETERGEAAPLHFDILILIVHHPNLSRLISNLTLSLQHNGRSLHRRQR
jgi:hypothetical protein